MEAILQSVREKGAGLEVVRRLLEMGVASASDIVQAAEKVEVRAITLAVLFKVHLVIARSLL